MKKETKLIQLKTHIEFIGWNKLQKKEGFLNGVRMLKTTHRKT